MSFRRFLFYNVVVCIWTIWVLTSAARFVLSWSECYPAASELGLMSRIGNQGTSLPFDSDLESVGSTQTLLDEIKFDMIQGASKLCGVSVALIRSVALRESGLIWPERRHAAIGYMQIKPSTAILVSPTLNVKRPWENFVAGACLLRQLYDKTGSWRKAIHAYRIGPNGKVTQVVQNYTDDVMEGM